MKDFFWHLFEKSGSIDAFLAYRQHCDGNNNKSSNSLEGKDNYGNIRN